MALELAAVEGETDIGRLELRRVTDSTKQTLHAHVDIDDDYFFITNLLVETSHRRQGVATRLMREAEKKAQNQIVLTCDETHEASRRLYQKLGYTATAATFAKTSTSVLLSKRLILSTTTQNYCPPQLDNIR